MDNENWESFVEAVNAIILNNSELLGTLVPSLQTNIQTGNTMPDNRLNFASAMRHLIESIPEVRKNNIENMATIYQLLEEYDKDEEEYNHDEECSIAFPNCAHLGGKRWKIAFKGELYSREVVVCSPCLNSIDNLECTARETPECLEHATLPEDGFIIQGFIGWEGNNFVMICDECEKELRYNDLD